MDFKDLKDGFYNPECGFIFGRGNIERYTTYTTIIKGRAHGVVKAGDMWYIYDSEHNPQSLIGFCTIDRNVSKEEELNILLSHTVIFGGHHLGGIQARIAEIRQAGYSDEEVSSSICIYLYKTFDQLVHFKMNRDLEAGRGPKVLDSDHCPF